MTQSQTFGVSLALMFALTVSTSADDNPSVVTTSGADAESPHSLSNEIQAAVRRSLPYIAERGQWWIDRKKCISCHRTTFSIWAVASAKQAGLEVNEDQLQDWVNYSYESLLSANDDKKIVATTNLDGVAQLLFVTQPMEESPDRAAQRSKLIDYLRTGQQEDGSWKPAGQLPSQKRPKPETTWVTTAWAQIYAASSDLPDDVQKQALSFLQSPKELTSTEALVVSLLLADEQRRPAEVRRLVAEQNEDGGWGWIRNEESNALATGQVLYALSAVRSAVSSDAREAAVRFLLTTQKEDGRWEVKGTKKNKQHRIEETASYWGTCWSAIGLLEANREKTPLTSLIDKVNTTVD